MERNLKEEKIKNNKGITLITLVITIIVILILGGVSIAMLIGKNGIITQAQNAKNETVEAEVKEKADLEEQNALIDNIVKNENNNIKEYHNGVPIPKGFYYVGGEKDTGLVISDNKGDEGLGTSFEISKSLQGNQFVWVPIKDEDFKRYSSYYNKALQTISNNYYEPSQEPNIYKKERIEYDQMESSVLKYDGFYVGRYEAGTTSDTARTITSGIDDEIVIKQGSIVYNYIGFSDSNDMTVETGGALQKSKEFASKNGYKSVTSTLIYGIEWDSIMQWIDPEYKKENGLLTSFLWNSENKGYYGQSVPTVTGSNEAYAVKNIYDLAGNVYEWTMEATNNGTRVVRGGNYNNSGIECPASCRSSSNSNPSSSNIYRGFRVALYIN